MKTSVKKGQTNKESYHQRMRQLGRRGEELACEFLVRNNMKIIDRNWRCSYGEADVIAMEGHTLVFCEIKTRRSLRYGNPAGAVTFKKRERYYKLINLYRSRSAIRHNSVRFDVISIFVDEDKRKAQLRYVRDAYANC
ncbi:MAG: YraN family protein [Coriobacteriia bacterium]|nr:YraN family protein [Coriobacteriia bacterium]MCL2746084.1 YraN family protein [Coriobacteriia bacterium]MCL2870664.1 YraN family protein [Coriobacteriia bacterium]